MVHWILFDLSEVLISGLLGVERALSRELLIPEEEILSCFEGYCFEQLLLGKISEDAYLAHVIAEGGWPIERSRLKALIRENFSTTVDGMVDILWDLESCHDLALISDHALEWAAHIQSIHPFMALFKQSFFSFELGSLKKDPQTFLTVLDALSVSPAACLFIDDNPENIRAAESVGIPGIHFVGAERLACELGRRQIRLRR